MKKATITLLLILSVVIGFSQPNDSLAIRRIFDQALTNGECYENLRHLCKQIGGRLSGSPEADKAIEWGKRVMDGYDLDRVFLQEVMVPHWVRGDKEELLVTQSSILGKKPMNVCALGGSIGTKGYLEAEIIEVHHLSDLKKLGRENVEGKIVFYNRPMEPRHIDTFHAYGGCVDQRSSGAVEASKFGALATIVRSMSHKNDQQPHTGAMRYEDGVKKIPACAIGTADADLLSATLKKEKRITVRLKMNCELLPDKKQYNVVGEIKGSTHPEEIILVGGHLDSWDTGEGAHDDGAGVVQSMEVLHLFKNLGIQPKRTLRAVLFINEENGNNGGKTYARLAAENKEYHLAAIESDRGGFAPRGFTFDTEDDVKLEQMQQWGELLEPYKLHILEKGYGGVDISPLKANGTGILAGLVPDSQRYFDYHHAPTDVFESVNKRELELGAASMATLVYLIDKYGLKAVK